LLTTRESASLILAGALILVLIIVPKLRRQIAPPARALLQAAFSRPLPVLYALVLAVSFASTALAWRVGIWEWDLAKHSVIITATVVLPMTLRSFTFKSGGQLARHVVRDTVGLTALLTFYLNTTPLSLVGELILQPCTTALVVLQAVARTDPKFLPAKRLCDVLLFTIGAFLLVWSTVTLFSSSPDWRWLSKSLLFTFWLPLSLLPFFYAFGFYALTGKVHARFRAIRKPPTLRLMLAFMVGTRLRMSLLASFTGRYNDVAHASGFRDGLRRMSKFRMDIARREREEAQRISALNQNAGRPGVDDDGHHVDRREFDVTKTQLDWIWACQNGQWERQGGRYWDHLTDTIVDAEKHGLPLDHGFRVEVADDSQVWRAWRRTPGGTVLGVGGREHRSMFYFQGPTQPTDWPGDSDEWVDAAREPWPPDWDMDDRTRV
jgi:hypothetical protein